MHFFLDALIMMLQPSFGIEKLMNTATNNEHHGVRMQHAHPCMHPMGSLSLNFNKSFSTHGISPFRTTKNQTSYFETTLPVEVA